MPLASECIKSKWDVQEDRIINCVTGMTRVGKGMSFSSSQVSRGLDPSPKSSPAQSSQFQSSTSRSLRSPSSSTVLNDGPPLSPVGLYGRARPEIIVGAHELSRSNPSRALWEAAQGLESRPSVPGSPQRPGSRASNSSSPMNSAFLHGSSSPSSSQRPRTTSSFCPGARSSPTSWSSQGTGASPGPCYVPSETAYHLQQRRLGRDPKSDSVAMMERPSTGAPRIGREKRFLPGLNYYVTMVCS